MTRISRATALLIALAAVIVSTGPLWTVDGVLEAAAVVVVAANLTAGVVVLGILVGWPRRYFGTGRR